MIKVLFRILKITNINLKEYFCNQIKGIVIILIYTISSLMMTNYIGFIVDKVIQKNKVSYLLIQVLGVLCIGIISILFRRISTIYYYKIGQNIILKMRQSILDRIIDSNNQFWSKNKIGDVLTVLERDVNQIEGLLTSGVSDLFINSFIIIGVSFFLIKTDSLIASLCITISVVFTVAQRLIGNNLKIKNESIREKIGHINSFTNEILMNANSIQILGYKPKILITYKNKQLNFIEESTNAVRVRSLSQCVNILYNISGNCLVLLIGGYKVYNNSMTIGTLFVISMYLTRLYSPIVGIANIYITAKNTVPLMNKMLTIMESTDIIVEGMCNSSNSETNISIRNLNYSYIFNHNKEYLFKNMNLEINQGQIIGIIGENGTGKTTLFKMLTRLCSPTTGDIYINNINIKNFNIEYFRSLVGVMPQEPFILHGTLRDNVMPINKVINDEVIIQTLEQICFNIREYAQGLDTIIEENKHSVSGGEAQKIALARVLLSNSPILLLDEPTSALDIESEVIITNILGDLEADKIVLIITHREELLKVCNRIIKIDNKKVKEILI